MQRYIFGKNTDKTSFITYDAVVIGGGIAGLYAALHLSPKLKCAVITKSGLEAGSSWLAQGGVSAVLSEEDSFDEHIADTLIAGAGHCDPEAVKVLVQEGPRDIHTLIDMGIPFDRNPDGSLHITREGGHSKNRIVHCGGDATGREITRRLEELVMSKEHINVLFKHYLVDIITIDNCVRGIVVNDGKKNYIILSRQVIIATGGAGQLYCYTTNPVGTAGDGIAACVRAGAVSKDMEFVQFHPTALASSENSERMFLISEAVRGEGGILRNIHGEAFMVGQHSLADLAPRDIVTRAILKEMEKTNSNKVFLDVAGMSREFFHQRFPTITAECLKYGIDVPDDFIPVCPTQHYLMGGIKTDLDGQTNIKGLSVCGEAACTGIQGANRLASNSTLECLVFGRRCAEYINENFNLPDKEISIMGNQNTKECPSEQEIEKIISDMKCLMTEKVGALRNMQDLKSAFKELSSLLEQANEYYYETQTQFDFINRIITSNLIVKAALNRPESLGSHHIIKK